MNAGRLFYVCVCLKLYDRMLPNGQRAIANESAKVAGSYSAPFEQAVRT